MSKTTSNAAPQVTNIFVVMYFEKAEIDNKSAPHFRSLQYMSERKANEFRDFCAEQVPTHYYYVSREQVFH